MRRIPVFLSTLALSGGLLVALSPANATIAPTPESMNRVSTEGGTTVVIGSDGKPYGTGINDYGQLTGPSPLQTTLTPLTGLPVDVRATSVVSGGSNVVVLGTDGKVYGSGVNTNCNIGTNGDHDVLAAIDNPTGGADLVAVATGSTHTVAIGSDGRLYGLGSNEYGQLPDHPNGLYTTSNAAWAPLASGLASDVTGISTGFRATILVADLEGSQLPVEAGRVRHRRGKQRNLRPDAS